MNKITIMKYKSNTPKEIILLYIRNEQSTNKIKKTVL